MRTKLKKAQGMVEYTLILGVVIGIVVWAVFRDGGVKEEVENTYSKSSTALNTVNSDLDFGIFAGSGTD